jgi:hypothetical protein
VVEEVRDAWTDRIDERFDHVDERFDRLIARFDSLERLIWIGGGLIWIFMVASTAAVAIRL